MSLFFQVLLNSNLWKRNMSLLTGNHHLPLLLSPLAELDGAYCSRCRPHISAAIRRYRRSNAHYLRFSSAKQEGTCAAGVWGERSFEQNNRLVKVRVRVERVVASPGIRRGQRIQWWASAGEDPDLSCAHSPADPPSHADALDGDPPTPPYSVDTYSKASSASSFYPALLPAIMNGEKLIRVSTVSIPNEGKFFLNEWYSLRVLQAGMIR